MKTLFLITAKTATFHRLENTYWLFSAQRKQIIGNENKKKKKTAETIRISVEKYQ